MVVIAFYCKQLRFQSKYIDFLVEKNTITEPAIVLLEHSSLTACSKKQIIMQYSTKKYCS